MKKAPNILIGNWRITGMEAWDADYFDMEVPAYLTIREDLTGEFQFGLVQAQLDGKIESTNAPSRLAFPANVRARHRAHHSAGHRQLASA